jgi:ABC-type uncharacterized transport system auxiliary subunit
MSSPARWLLLALALPGCALLSKAEPRVPRYFTPESPAQAAVHPAAPGPRLRLGRVEGSSHLRERLAHRGAGGEVWYAEGLRWTERPEVYLRRALARTLFEERGLVQVVSGRGVTLEVELTAFEELDRPHVARMEARLLLRDDRASLRIETVAVEAPVGEAAGGDPAAAVVEAHARALRTAVSQLADLVEAALAAHPPEGAASLGGAP